MNKNQEFTSQAKPTFNVVIPFDGVTVVQMNRTMSALLSNFIFDFDDVTTEMYALAECLRTPGSWHRKSTGTAFSVDAFGDMVNLSLNKRMAESLTKFINEVHNDGEHVEVEIRALSRGVNDPVACYQLRMEKILNKNNDSENGDRSGARTRINKHATNYG